LRTWTDNTGTYHVEAKFAASLEDGSVRLVRADGRYVRVAFDRLSLLDQQSVREHVDKIAMSW